MTYEKHCSALTGTPIVVRIEYMEFAPDRDRILNFPKIPFKCNHGISCTKKCSLAQANDLVSCKDFLFTD